MTAPVIAAIVGTAIGCGVPALVAVAVLWYQIRVLNARNRDMKQAWKAEYQEWKELA